MAWPPNLSSGAFFASGTLASTLVWGTDGISGTYRVLTVRYAQDNEIIYIEDGSGMRDTRLHFRQGEMVDINVIDVKATAPPQTGATISLIIPSGSSTNFIVLNADFDGARKQEGRRTIRAVYDTMIEGAGTPLANG